MSVRGGKELCGGKIQAQIRTDFSVLCQKMRRAHGNIRNKLNYLYINLSVKTARTLEAVFSWGLHAKLLNMGGRVLLVKLPLVSFAIYRVVLKCREGFSSVGFSLAESLAWHHGYVANTLIVSVG